MLLTDYIQDQGVTKVARMLNISQSAVSGWLHGNSIPSDIFKYKINKMSCGLVRYEEMINPHIYRLVERGEIKDADLEINTSHL